MPSPEQKLTFLLTGGIDETTVDELTAPIVQQNSAPTLKESDNTRLSVIANSCVRSPLVSSAGIDLIDGADCYGIAPAVSGENAAVFFRPQQGGSYVLADAGRTSYGTGVIRSPFDNTKASQCYLPVDIVGSGAIPSVSPDAPAATVFEVNTGLIWFAYLSPNPTTPTNFDLYVLAMDDSGTFAARPKVVTTLTAPTTKWVGLTAHGANGVRLWYIDTGLKMVTPTVASGLITTSAATAIYTPASLIASDWDIVSFPFGTYAQYAYFIGTSAGSATTAAITRVTVTSGVTSVFTLPASTVGGASLGLVSIAADIPASGTFTIAYACSSYSAVTTHIGSLDGSTMGALTATTVSSMYGRTNVGLLVATTLGYSHIVCAVDQLTVGPGAGFSGGGYQRIAVYFAPLAGGAATLGYSIPWMRLQSRGVQWRLTSQESYPLLFLSRSYGPASLPTDPNYVDDPSVEVYMVGHTYAASPIARYGTVRGIQLPAAQSPTVMYSKAVTTLGLGSGKFYATYNKAQLGTTGGGRYVVIDMTPRQSAVAHDRDGAVMVAAALPVQWDGVDVVEIGGPLHKPRAYGTAGGGGGPVLTSGTYRFQVVYQWTDAAGLLHRSAPSNLVSLALNGTTDRPYIAAPLPDSMRDGINQSAVEAILYASGPGGTTLHAQLSAPSITISYLFVWNNIPQPDTSKAQLYSNGASGEEIVPQAPAPMWDIAVVGSRALAIDAEVRSRLMYSKLRVAGVGFEWAPALEIIFPEDAGKLMAVRGLNGVPVIFAERGVYTVSGDGPNNNAQVGSFSPPVKVGEHGCTNRCSVVVTPVGIVYQTKSRFALFTGNGTKLLEQVAPDSNTTCGVLLKNQDEAAFFNSGTAKVYVYNYKLDRWTVWDSQTHAYPVQLATNVPSDADICLLYSKTPAVVYRLDGSQTSTTATNMAWTTDWIQPAGDAHDHISLREVVFNGKIAGAHGLTIEVYTDYSSTPTTSKTYSAAEITALADANGRYTLSVDPVVKDTRAVKLRVYDSATATAGVRPISLTLLWALNSGRYDRGLKPNARK